MLRLLAWCLAVPALFAAWAPGALAQAGEQVLPVIVVPGLELGDLRRIESRGAVGLLVPAAGPTTSGADAREALVRGEVRNSLRGGGPTGPQLIDFVTASSVPESGPAIVIGLPSGGREPNDDRYPIAVLGAGYEGLLVSESTRIPGLVSIADVAPTALRTDQALERTPAEGAAEQILELDARIRDNRASGFAGWLLTAVLLFVLAVVRPRAAVFGFGAALVANLLLGSAGISEPWVAIAVIGFSVAVGAPLLERRVPRGAATGLVLAVVPLAYLVALGVAGEAVSLSPLGPTQNSRFFGVSNLLETLLLVPALAGAALLSRRLGPAAFAGVAAISLLAVAGDRFGADGGGAIVLGIGFAVLAVELAGGGRGGAIVLGIGFAVLAVELAGGGRRSLAIGLATAAVLVAILAAIDAATGGSSHLARSVRDGPADLAGDFKDRMVLSFERATVDWYVTLVIVLALLILLTLFVRLLRSDASPGERAVPVALAAAVLTSLTVNDSPSEIAVGGLIGFLACRPGTLATDAPPPSTRSSPRRTRVGPRPGGLRRRRDSRAPA